MNSLVHSFYFPIVLVANLSTKKITKKYLQFDFKNIWDVICKISMCIYFMNLGTLKSLTISKLIHLLT